MRPQRLAVLLASVCLTWTAPASAQVVSTRNAITCAGANRAGPTSQLDIALVQGAAHNSAQTIQGSPTGTVAPLPLRVRIHGSASLADSMLERSRVRLGGILEQAGVALKWRDCRSLASDPAWCGRPPSAEEAVVRLQAGAPTDAHACGISHLPDNAPAHYVTVFVECVRAGAESLGVGEDVVLAYTMAHEIGHLLLGQDHSGHGLMQARPRVIDWWRAAHGGFAFTAAEAERLRQALRDRIRP